MNWKWYYAIVIPLWLIGLLVIGVIAQQHYDAWPYWTALGIDTLLFGAVIGPPIAWTAKPRPF